MLQVFIRIANAFNSNSYRKMIKSTGSQIIAGGKILFSKYLGGDPCTAQWGGLRKDKQLIVHYYPTNVNSKFEPVTSPSVTPSRFLF